MTGQGRDAAGLPAPGVVSGPGYPPADAATPPSNGGISWGLGFLAWIGIPVVNYLLAAAVQTTTRRSVARGGAVAAENARNAVNWAWTAVVATGGSLLVAVIGLAILRDDGVWFLMLFGVVYLAVSVTHFVVIIRGLVRASRAQVLRVPFAIPFRRR